MEAFGQTMTNLMVDWWLIDVNWWFSNLAWSQTSTIVGHRRANPHRSIVQAGSRLQVLEPKNNIKQPETFVCVSLWQWRFPLQMVRTGETTTYLWLGVQVGNHKWIIFKCHRGSDLWMEQIHTEGVHFGVRRAALLQDPSSCGESHAGCQDLACLEKFKSLKQQPDAGCGSPEPGIHHERRPIWSITALKSPYVRDSDHTLVPGCFTCLLVQIVDPGQRSVAEVLRYQTSMRNRNHCQWVYNRNELFMIEQGSLSFVIKHCNGKAPINWGFNMIRIFKWGIFHCSVSLNIIFGGHKKKICSAPKRKGRKPRPVNQPSTTPTRWRLPVSWSFSSWSQQNDQVPCPQNGWYPLVIKCG